MKYILFTIGLCTALATPHIQAIEFERDGSINFLASPYGQGIISIIPAAVAVNRQPYTNGGLTFTFNNAFTSTPRVLVTVQLVNAASPTTTYSAVITAVSTTSVTVLVYNISNGGTVAEAATNEVNVTMFAIDDIQ